MINILKLLRVKFSKIKLPNSYPKPFQTDFQYAKADINRMKTFFLGKSTRMAKM